MADFFNKKNITIISSVILSIVLVTFALTANRGVKSVTDYNNVNIEEGIQIINIKSTNKGYFPEVTVAKAGLQTVLRMESENSYGCERSFRIPDLGIDEILPTEGSTDIDLGTPEQGKKIFGTCSMGMYTFSLEFK